LKSGSSEPGSCFFSLFNLKNQPKYHRAAKQNFKKLKLLAYINSKRGKMTEKSKKQEAKSGHDHSHECNDPECGHEHDHSAEENLQSKYYEFQLIGEQIKQLQQQGAALDEQMQELQQAMQGLAELESGKEGADILVPISQGIFVKASLKETKNLIVSVGNNVMVKKDLASTIDMINERIDAVNIYKSDTNRTLTELMKRAKELEKELQLILQGIKG
jgi:prefoldin alpha subunit